MSSFMKKESKKTLRERKKAVNQAKVIEVAHQRFHEFGYEATTIEEICAASMISKRTFFRYFQDKESLLFPNREERLAEFIEFLELNEQKEPFDVLRQTTQFFGQKYNEHRHRIMLQQALIRSSDGLLAREREIDQDWGREISKAFLRRAGDDQENQLWAQVLAGAIMGVVRATMSYWFEHGCEDDLIQIGLKAIDCLEQGFVFPLKLE
jgi:AcrR family transcriptional regulator